MKKKKYAIGGENILQEVNVVAKRKPKNIETPIKKPETNEWNEVENTVHYIKNGKRVIGTVDSMKQDLSADYEKYKTIGVSDKTIDKLIKDTYKVEYRGTTLSPTDETQQTLNNKVKPKYFLGAVLGLAGQAVGAIIQNNAQKKQVAEQNKIVEQQNAAQIEQRINTEEVSQRNFGSNTPMHSFYANGGNIGVVPESVGMSVVRGAKHENGGVDYKQVEVEGGEVIKHEGSNDFIFSDRILFDNERTYGDVAKQFAEQKGIIEKQVGMTLKKLDKLNKDYSESGSKLKSSTTNRLMEKTNLELAKLKEQDNQIEQQVEQLKEHQLQKGMALGLYNEDGTPKDTDGKFTEGSYLKTPIVGITGIKKIVPPTTFGKLPGQTTTVETSTTNPNFLKGVGNFLGSNAGQAVTGMVGTGINLVSNIATTKNMSKLKTPTFVPTKIQDTQKVNMSASRQAIEDSANEQNAYVEQNFANPQVAAAMKAKIEADKLKRLGEVNQQEQTTNIGIEYSNIARRANMETANNAGFQQKQLMDYQKTSQDINNTSNVVGALVKDTNDVMTNYRKGVMEERTIDMYGKAQAGSVSEELKAAMMDGVDLQKVRNMNVTEANDYLIKVGITDKDKLNKWLKYAK